MKTKYILKTIATLLLTGGILMTTSCGSNDTSTTSNLSSEETTTTTTQKPKKSPEEYGKVIALTFDDGPNLTTTPIVLDKLEEYGVVASFFVVGNNINDDTAEVMKRAYEMGCEIDNHSQTHSYMNSMTADEITAEINYTSDKVKEIIGVPTTFFRPPYIAVNQTMFDTIDMPFICGSGCDDWDANVSVDTRVEKTLAQATDGGIILLHDADGNFKTAEALDRIIQGLLDDGYELVTVSDLFYAKGIEITSDTDIVYSNCLQTTQY